MNTKDVIRLFGNSMLIDFAATGASGSITTVRLEDGVRFALEGAVIRAHFFSEPSPAMIERFPSEELAASAFRYLQTFLRRHVLLRRVKNALKKAILWGVAPLVALMLALSLNVAISRGAEPRSSAANALSPQATHALPVSSAPAGARRPALSTTAADLARAMADGARAEKFSVRLSKGKEGTLYVFSDPGCSYCRALEPELETLGKRFTIHLFPVSVIGGSQSAEHAASVMCVSTGLRAAAWRKLTGNASPSAPGCATGDLAISANDEIFRAAGLTATPTIIAANGSTYPESNPNTAAAIAEWAKHAASGH